ncbi:hypothetical protein FOA52_002875 [Chlamydomonas sp. UWO 241]|nr:hypothetical protein FOA52_002875 [Chlamydomonas sp. UWO 241]
MDVEPIYCAEQIVVPVDLADVLKAFTKEVIRRQPDDLVEFGAKYFANLADVASSAEEAPVPTREQLAHVLSRAGGAISLPRQQVQALCNQAGISASAAGRVLEVGKFEKGGEVGVDKFLFLLLAMTADSFASVTAGIFELFGAELDSSRFIGLIGYLAPDMDPEVTTQFLADLSSLLMDVPTVTYSQVAVLPLLEAKINA